MTMMAFHTIFPEVAQNECRTVMPFNSKDLPNRTFFFVEAYCVEFGCDCRRVMLDVVDAETWKQVATINYGFEPPAPPFEDEGQAFLDPLNPQSNLSDALLDLFEKVIIRDPAYHDRLVRHYEMWKKVVNDPQHPAQETIRAAKPGCGICASQEPAREPVRRSEPKIGPNDPCPCGSGRKYKKCCRP